jgi:hypothetical protein
MANLKKKKSIVRRKQEKVKSNQSPGVLMKVEDINRPLLKDKVSKGGVDNFIRDNHLSGTKISSMDIVFVVLDLVIKP